MSIEQKTVIIQSSRPRKCPDREKNCWFANIINIALCNNDQSLRELALCLRGIKGIRVQQNGSGVVTVSCRISDPWTCGMTILTDGDTQ